VLLRVRVCKVQVLSELVCTWIPAPVRNLFEGMIFLPEYGVFMGDGGAGWQIRLARGPCLTGAAEQQGNQSKARAKGAIRATVSIMLRSVRGEIGKREALLRLPLLSLVGLHRSAHAGHALRGIWALRVMNWILCAA
jgi:hypothetical protein